MMLIGVVLVIAPYSRIPPRAFHVVLSTFIMNGAATSALTPRVVSGRCLPGCRITSTSRVSDRNGWSKPLKDMKLATFNARAETLAGKPTFRSAFTRTRCLIPASAYYEWRDAPGGKQPYCFTRAGRGADYNRWAVGRMDGQGGT